MPKIRRFGVSLDESLLKKFDDLIFRTGYRSRSEAIRSLVRDRLVADQWRTPGKTMVGILAIVYSHGSRELSESLNLIQHRHLRLVVSSNHVHLDEHNCLEVIILKGRSALIKSVADELINKRNVKHGQLIMTTTGKEMG